MIYRPPALNCTHSRGTAPGEPLQNDTYLQKKNKVLGSNCGGVDRERPSGSDRGRSADDEVPHGNTEAQLVH